MIGRKVRRELFHLGLLVKADRSLVHICAVRFMGYRSIRKHERVNRYIQGDVEYVGVEQLSFCVPAHRLWKSKLDWHQVKLHAKS